MKQIFKVLGSLAALAATITGIVALDFGTNNAPGGVNPMGAVALGVAALALFKAAEQWD